MTVKEFWESEEYLAIHCDTEEKANKLLKKFYELGKKWRDGDSYLKCNEWNVYKQNTCYNNRCGYNHLNGEYVNTYKVKIIEFDDLEDFKEAEK